MILSLERINAAAAHELVALLDGVYAASEWIAKDAAARRPFRSLPALKRALIDAVRASSREHQLALIHAHADALGKTRIAQIVSGEGTNAGSVGDAGGRVPSGLARLERLDAEYRERFGFPFLHALQGPRARGLSASEIFATLECRLGNHPQFEFAEALRSVHRAAEVRLDERCGFVPVLGDTVWDWAEQLARYSDPGYAERGQLTVTYLTEANPHCSRIQCSRRWAHAR